MLVSVSSFFILFLACQAKSESDPYQARIVSVLVNQTNMAYRAIPVSSALILAVKRANLLYTGIHLELTFRISWENCAESYAVAMAAEEYFLRNATVFVGPGCGRALDGVARMAAFWNVPLLTGDGVDPIFLDKQLYPTLTRLSFSVHRVCQFVLAVLRQFHWHHASVLADEVQGVFLDTAKSLLLMAKNENKERDYHLDMEIFAFNSSQEPFKPEKILATANKRSRVFIIMSESLVVREVLLAAFDLKMIEGNHVFLALDLIKGEDNNEDIPWFKSGSRRNRDARLAYESVMVICVRVPTGPKYSLFVSEVVHTSKKEFNVTINPSTVNPIVAAFHDCVMLYAWALNATLAEGDDPFDGRTLVRRLWNRTFARELTGDIFVNDNGDREADFTLDDMDTLTGKMRPVANYLGRNMRYQPLPGVAIQWPGNSQVPPPDVPYCGFLNDALRCRQKDTLPVGSLVSVVFCLVALLIACIVGLILFRKMKLESQLSDLWWKVHYRDLVFPSHRRAVSTASSNISDDLSFGVSKPSTSSSTETYSLGIQIAILKGCKVAVKSLDITSTKIPRSVLVELKQMKDITHENLVRFIGISVDGPQCLVLTDVCSRGSLRDVLETESLKIDWDFRYSIIGDIVEGMKFLHSSFIAFHGHLKSTNCLIDGRFSVKISGYGLRKLREQIKQDEIQNPRKLFWTSPEQLRSSNPTLGESQKGDVYSFGIILQEVVTRTGPFENTDNGRRQYLDPKEVLLRVRERRTPPFRPEVSPDAGPQIILDLMHSCWDECPENRPDFAQIKIRIKKLFRSGSSKNLLDIILQRMEKYATDLESLVEEKTRTLIEEKLKTDQLLYQLLPSKIAEDLKSGRLVEPETFDSTTVFFSDVVGFTPISARSTPMQVVDFLNDLYTCMDSIIDKFDAYKAETIGDAYMVVSGLPVRNGDRHASEVARMALALRNATTKFEIKHLPGHQLILRIGLHSGPCAAGVVGLKMPRYCVFGSTVNIASKMESTGKGMKIHVSEVTKNMLRDGKFVLQYRGDVAVMAIKTSSKTTPFEQVIEKN